MCSKPKVPTAQPAPPAPTPVSNAETESGDRQAVKATRKKKGAGSTVLTQDSILGAVGQATGSLKKTLG